MSYGFSNPYDPLSADQNARKSTVMRGPMASGVIQRLATETNWGDLDYLVVDFPPGTGDIQLTLAQNLNFASAVIVTTPQRLAHVDVVKGMDMFDKVKVPIIGIVENMSYFECNSCGDKAYPFGTGKTQELASTFGIQNLYELPMHADVSAHGDSGDPVVLSDSKTVASVVDTYDAIASMVVSETAALSDLKNKHGTILPTVTASGDNVIYTKASGESLRIPAVELRRACGGAGNKNPEHVKEDVVPKAIQARGNYAVSISWSDGHNSIYPFEQIEALAPTASS